METNQSQKVRLIMDNGSHRTYITEWCTRLLGLRNLKEEELCIAVFGATQTRVVKLNQVKFKIKLCDGSSMVIMAHITPTITISPIQSKCLPEETVKAIKSMQYAMADELENRNNIDILIGSDYFWDLVTGSPMTLPGGMYIYNCISLGIVVGRKIQRQGEE